MTQPDLTQILTEAEADRRRDRARSAQATTVANAASGDYTVGVVTGAGEGNLVYLDENGKINPAYLYPSASTDTARTYVHVQSVPSTTWTIAHYLDGYPPVVLIAAGSGTGQSPQAEAHYPDENHVLVKFGRPKTGTCHLSL